MKWLVFVICILCLVSVSESKVCEIQKFNEQYVNLRCRTTGDDIPEIEEGLGVFRVYVMTECPSKLELRTLMTKIEGNFDVAP